MMKRYFGLQVFLAALLIIMVLPLSAQSADQENQAYELGEIVVSAPGSSTETVANVSRISAQEIKDMGARTLDEALRFVPGLYVRIGGSGTPRIDSRGLRTRHVMLLLDGIPIKNTYDDQFDPTLIPVDYIQEIKISTGGTSQLYGPGGSGGIINVITKKGTPGFHGSLTGEVAEGNAYLGRATAYGASGKFNSFGSLSSYDRDAYGLAHDFKPTKDEGGGDRNNSDMKRKNLFTGFGYTPDEKTDLGFTFNYLDGENGVPPRTNYDKSDPFSRKPKYERIDDIEGYKAQFAGSHDISKALGLRGWVFFNQQDETEKRYDDDTYTTQEKNGSYRQDATTEISGANIQLSYDIVENHNASLGLMFENDSWDADGFSINKKEEKEHFSTDKDVDYYSIALDYEAGIFPNAGLLFGGGQHFMDKDSGDNTDAFSYMTGAWYDLCDETRLSASYSRKIRFPSIRQLYDVDDGNPDLDEEKTYQYEIGLEQVLPVQTSFSVSGYWIDAKDYIEKVGDDIYRNYEKYRFKGVDVVLANRAVENLLVSVSYSYLDSEDRSPDTGRDELQYRPKNKWAGETTYRFVFGLTARASVLYVADQYLYDDDNPMSTEKKKLNNFTVVDFKLSQGFLDDVVVAYAGVDNLLDENYEQSYGLPQPGRTGYAGLEYHF